MSEGDELRSKFSAVVIDEAELRGLIAPPGELVLRKQLETLDDHQRLY